MAGVDLLREPGAGVGIAVAEQDDARRDLADEIERLAAIGVGGEIKILHLTAFGDFTRARTEDERLTRLR